MASIELTQNLNEELREFYDCLIAKRLTQVFPKENQTNQGVGPIQRVLKPLSTPWHTFLDLLCLLVCTKRAGEGVTALGASVDESRVLLWIATNREDHMDSAYNLLNEILQRLKAASSDQEQNMQFHISAICQMSIARSSDRIKNYRNLLNSALQVLRKDTDLDPAQSESTSSQATHSIPSSNQSHISESSLITSLTTFATSLNQRSKLPENVQTFRDTPDFHLLRTLSSTSPPFRQAWHMFGRLNSWSKAAKLLVQLAPRFAEVLSTLELRRIPAPSNSPTLSSISIPSTVDACLTQALSPPLAGAPLEHAIDLLGYSQDKLDELRDDKKDEPILHAEVAVAQFFDAKKLTFANEDDRYIGCSKPCCYACALYLKRHKMGFKERACHGNAWVKWRFPEVMTTIDEKGNGTVDDRASVDLVRKMAQDARADIVQAVNLGWVGRKRRWESTTGTTGGMVRRY